MLSAKSTAATIPCSGQQQVVGYWISWTDASGKNHRKFTRQLPRALSFKKRLPFGSGGTISPRMR